MIGRSNKNINKKKFNDQKQQNKKKNNQKQRTENKDEKWKIMKKNKKME